MVNENLPLGGEVMNIAGGDLSDAMRVALAWATGPTRTVLLPLMLLDERLGRIVAAAREPMLAQMRLAWWRDRLGEAPGLRPRGDPVLDAIGLHWIGQEAALVGLVDAWEELLGEAPLGENSLERFAAGKGAAFAALARLCAEPAYAAAAHAHGRRYALGDCLARLSNPVERERLRNVALHRDRLGRLPGGLRPLAILSGLGGRVLRRGEGPLFGDRGSALLATRLGILGR